MFQFPNESLLGIVGERGESLNPHANKGAGKPEKVTRGVITRLLVKEKRLWKTAHEYLPFGAVAHRLEQPAYIRRAAGSIPACPTNHTRDPVNSNLDNISGSSNPAGHLTLNQRILVRVQAPEPSGCSSVSRVPHLECGGRWGGTSHPDQSINKRPFKMRFIIANVAVNFSQHAPVLMPHDGGDGEMVMALDEFAGAESMTGGICEHLAPDLFRDSSEAVAYSKFAPCSATLIDKQLSRPALGHETGNDFKGNALKVDNALFPLTLGFNSGKYDALPVKFHMARLDMPSFLRPATRMPNEQEQVAERIAFRNKSKNLLEVGRLHVGFPALGRRFLELGDGIDLKVSLLYRPVVNTLHGNHSAPAVGAAPCRLAIHPFLNMKWFDGRCVQISNAGIFQEAVEVICVPFARTRRTMFATPSGVLGNECVYRKSISMHFVIDNRNYGW
jgi:hypothetical protein